MSKLNNSISGFAVAGILQAAAIAALVNSDALADAASIGASLLPRAAYVEDASLPEWLASSGKTGATQSEDVQRAAALQAMPPFATFLVGLSSSEPPR